MSAGSWLRGACVRLKRTRNIVAHQQIQIHGGIEMSIRQLLGIGITLVGLIALVLVPGWRAIAQGRLIVWPTEAIRWTNMGAVPGAKQAVLWGDPTKGAYGALKQVPGGTLLPLHTHKNDSRLLNVKGMVALEVEGKTTAM